MPRVRYTCPVPQRPGMTAFAPMPAHYANVTTAYKSDVVGEPGTLGIAAPTWESGEIDQFRDDNHKAGLQPKLSGGPAGSGYAPDVWYPTKYYEDMHRSYGSGGVAIYSDNQLPMPAIDPRLAGLNARAVAASSRWDSVTAGPRGFPGVNDFTQPAGRQSGSQRHVRWPRRVPRWRPWGKGPANA